MNIEFNYNMKEKKMYVNNTEYCNIPYYEYDIIFQLIKRIDDESILLQSVNDYIEHLKSRLFIRYYKIQDVDFEVIYDMRSEITCIYNLESLKAIYEKSNKKRYDKLCDYISKCKRLSSINDIFDEIYNKNKKELL